MKTSQKWIAMRTYEISKFLRERQALLVHFSTPARRDRYVKFPDCLNFAWTLRDQPLSFSTIQSSDTAMNAAGSVGVIVKLRCQTKVLTVGSTDDGTIFNTVEKNYQSGGEEPSPKSCAQSLDKRTTYNEWFLEHFQPVGIFVFEPIFVWRVDSGFVDPITNMQTGLYGEGPANLIEIVEAFPYTSIYKASGGEFFRWEVSKKVWLPVTFDQIQKRNAVLEILYVICSFCHHAWKGLVRWLKIKSSGLTVI